MAAMNYPDVPFNIVTGCLIQFDSSTSTGNNVVSLMVSPSALPGGIPPPSSYTAGSDVATAVAASSDTVFPVDDAEKATKLADLEPSPPVRIRIVFVSIDI